MPYPTRKELHDRLTKLELQHLELVNRLKQTDELTGLEMVNRLNQLEREMKEVQQELAKRLTLNQQT